MNSNYHRRTPSIDYAIYNLEDFSSDKENSSYSCSLGEYKGIIELNENLTFRTMYNEFYNVNTSELIPGTQFAKEIKLYIQINIEECHSNPNFFVDDELIFNEFMKSRCEKFNAHIILVASSLDIKRLRN